MADLTIRCANGEHDECAWRYPNGGCPCSCHQPAVSGDDSEFCAALDDITGFSADVYQHRGNVLVRFGNTRRVFTQEQAAALADAITLARTCAAGWEAEQDA